MRTLIHVALASCLILIGSVAHANRLHFNNGNASTGITTVTVTFGDGAVMKVKGGSTAMGTVGSTIDAVTGCSLVSTNNYTCSGDTVPTLADDVLVDIGALAREIDYDFDGDDPPAGWSWNSYVRGAFTFTIALPDEDLEDFEDHLYDGYSIDSMTCEPCSTLRNQDDQVVACGTTGNDCECCVVTPDPPPPPPPPVMTPVELEFWRSFESAH